MERTIISISGRVIWQDADYARAEREYRDLDKGEL